MEFLKGSSPSSRRLLANCRGMSKRSRYIVKNCNGTYSIVTVEPVFTIDPEFVDNWLGVNPSLWATQYATEFTTLSCTQPPTQFLFNTKARQL